MIRILPTAEPSRQSLERQTSEPRPMIRPTKRAGWIVPEPKASITSLNSSGRVVHREMDGELLHERRHRPERVLFGAHAGNNNAALRRGWRRCTRRAARACRRIRWPRRTHQDRPLASASVSVAPKACPPARRASFGSTTVIRPAPRKRAQVALVSPTVPAPTTRTASPGSMPTVSTVWSPTAYGSTRAAWRRSTGSARQRRHGGHNGELGEPTRAPTQTDQHRRRGVDNVSRLAGGARPARLHRQYRRVHARLTIPASQDRPRQPHRRTRDP